MSSLATLARAQSTASFPTLVRAPAEPPPPPATPTPASKPAPVILGPAPMAPASPAVGSSAAPSKSKSADSTTLGRYPLPALSLPTDPAAAPLYPALLPYRAGLPVPAGYRVEQRAAKGLIVGGLASLTLAYAAALSVAASDGFDNGTGWLLLPVAGPWAAIGARNYHCDNNPARANACVNGAFNQVQTIAILSADAVVQATGAVLFLAGLGSGRDELLRSDLQAAVRVTPRAVGNRGFGIGFDGLF